MREVRKDIKNVKGEDKKSNKNRVQSFISLIKDDNK